VLFLWSWHWDPFEERGRSTDQFLATYNTVSDMILRIPRSDFRCNTTYCSLSLDDIDGPFVEAMAVQIDFIIVP
jgi:hypothetical protein